MKPVQLDEPLLRCRFCDLQVVQNLSQVLLRGLAAACIDSTKGDLFKGPVSVALDVRNEMVDYLTRRSKSYTAEPVIQPCDLELEFTEFPTKIISGLANEFASLKRNLLSRVSGWLLSEGRGSKIDIFSQEMATNGFWPFTDREVIAETLLRYVDIKKEFNCAMSFDSSEQLGEHKAQCGFRPVNCLNEGCKSRFSAVYLRAHDLECPFKIIPCEQKCSQSIVRYQMHEHCNTVCPMKLVNCPFYKAGCQSTFLQCNTEQHYSEFLHSHLLCVLQIIYRQEASVEDLRKRVLLLEKAHEMSFSSNSQSLNEQSEALDVRSLTLAIKEQEAKMKKLESNLSKISQRST